MALRTNEQFQNDFMNRYGINLQTCLADYHFLGGYNTQKHILFAERAKQLVLLKIGEYNPKFKLEKASEFQLQKIWDASLEQAFFMFMTGDSTLISGFDPVSGSLVPYEEIRKRQFSDIAYKQLLHAGLLYTGLGSTRRGLYPL